MAEIATQPGVKSAMRTLDLIEFVVAHPSGVAAQQIADALAIPASSLSYLLATLIDREYLKRDGRRYLAGNGLDRLRRPRTSYSLAEEAAPLIRALRQQFDETTSLFVPAELEMQVAITETSGQSLRYALTVGAKVPLHCVAAGKALLAAYPHDQLETYLERATLTRYTARTICDRASLLGELETIRELGIGETRDELTAGISGLGVAIRREGGAVGAMGIAVPSIRLDPELKARITAALRATALQLGTG